VEESAGRVAVVGESAVFRSVAVDQEIPERLELALFGIFLFPLWLQPAGLGKPPFLLAELLLPLDLVSELPGLVKRLVVLGPLFSVQFPLLALGSVKQFPSLRNKCRAFLHHFPDIHFIPPTFEVFPGDIPGLLVPVPVLFCAPSPRPAGTARRWWPWGMPDT